MISLLVWACLVAQPSDCHVELIVSGFEANDPCIAQSSQLVAGWMALHPELKPREGTRPICTGDANHLLNRFKA